MSSGRGASGGRPGWSNWAGDQTCHPQKIVRPRNLDALEAEVAVAADAGRKISVAGSGHSFTEAAMTDSVMMRIEALDRILEADATSGLAKVEAGITLAGLSERLDGFGLAMENLGDINTQTIAGAISTATHGTGAGLRNISAQVVAMELVLADGSLRELTSDSDPDLLRAARVGVGALGAIATVTLQCVPAFNLHRIDQPQPIDQVLSSFEELAESNDHFEFFVFPCTDDALTIRRNRTDVAPRPRSAARRFLGDTVLENGGGDLMLRTVRRWPKSAPRFTGLAARVMSQGDQLDRSDRIFANQRSIRFTEMEYALPREHGPEAVSRVLELIRRERIEVAMPIECRVVAPDDAFLSPAHERPTVYVAVHQYRGMPWRRYFEVVTEIMEGFGGRPHWGKRHLQTAATLAGRYPRWDDFQTVRDQLDPGRVFTNEYAERVLGP